MRKRQDGPFPYYVGVDSLHDIVNKHSRVCVMNILGGESSKVTPVSHVYSGANVVAGVQYGRGGAALETPIGDIPVYGSVEDVIRSGHEFDVGVIYLPPAAVSHAVSELCAGNPGLQRIVIVTEKVSVRDSRYIRWGCQNARVDVIGANSLGVANTWDQVRVGGALGGDRPGETLKQGSVAIYSNSGNFGTTLAEYLKTAGFGTSTILSSGKDLYIHFALPEFLYAAENDPRTKVILCYIEPGGYYEKQALDWIQEGRYQLTKPIVAVVTGRWKKNLKRAVGHAGALGGSGDDAESKERWFDSYFGVGVFNPARPQVSERGVRVANIQDVPLAVREVTKICGHTVDFEPLGDLSLKPWFVNEQDIPLPSSLALDAVKAVHPYDDEIEKANRQVGAQFIRQNMRNKSGASLMSPKTQVAELHGESILNLVKYPFAEVSIFSITKTLPDLHQLKIIAPVLNWFVHAGMKYSDIAQQSRSQGASPNAYVSAGVLVAGNNPMFEAFRKNTSALIDLFFVDIGRKLDIRTALIDRKLKQSTQFAQEEKIPPGHDELAIFFGRLLKRHGQENIFTRFAASYNEMHKDDKGRGDPLYLMLSAILLGMAWKSLTEKQITRQQAEEMGVYLAVNGIIAATSCTNPNKNRHFKQLSSLKKLDVLKGDYTGTLFALLFDRDHTEQELFALNSLLNLTITNGPGTISAKGAKESVSAQNHISTAFAGFMSNTGYAHGGNGYEAVQFLVDELGDYDPYKESHETLDSSLAELAKGAAANYAQYKKQAKAEGLLDYRKIPCTNHPVFKGKPVNIDPREDYVRALLKKNGMLNPFLEFYHHLVVEMHRIGVTNNVFCVNIDAVIASVSLELFWKSFKQKLVSEADMKDIVFSMFLLGRMVGINAEIADHRARGTAMDCRTPANELGFVN